MRLEYSLKLRPEAVHVAESLKDDKVKIDGVIFKWTSQNGRLKSMDLILERTKMQFACEGAIEASSKDIGKMVAVGKYLADRILAQTNTDVIDIESSFNGSPKMFPESIEEEEEFTKRRTIVYKSQIIGWKHTLNFEPKYYPDGYKNAHAFADYADGLRAIHEKSKAVFYYRVLEHFSKNPKSVQKSSFYKYVSKFDKSSVFTENKIEDIKNLRVDSAHACSKSKPKNSTIEDLRKFALLILENPPKDKL